MYASTVRSVCFSALAAACLLLAGCNKESDELSPDRTASAEDYATVEEENVTMSDLTAAAEPADLTTSGSPAVAPDDLRLILPDCATRTYDAATHTLTLDFGPTNCLDARGVARRGKIVVVFQGERRQPGASATISLVDYYVNDRHHTGTRIITTLENGSYSLLVQDASVTTPRGTASWNSERTYTRTAGFGTRTVFDDEYKVTGKAAGVNRQGVAYTAQIEQPLVKVLRRGCARHFVAGTITITNYKNRSLLLNYDPTGTQACDNIASVTIDGKTRLINLR
ncbi:hypothetical protein PK28_02770 [Hymenobacter sp. DG25B]|uniref:hypothetical protein n=1 Tax=Hymenobacter sp. DG25B TaxID=1385664 RepID=UPI000540CF8F|nr:hypothetical protein [Hymenobacter sp. DG25B]AIZ62876.1 hypothetical protein PK28_02770 [Hymenobacter sp. DG25B]